MFEGFKETAITALVCMLLVPAFFGCAAFAPEHKITRSPVDTVKLFDRTYGSSSMDKTADIITEKMRDGLPRTVWVYDRWKTMNEIEYKRLHSEILEVKKKNDRAVVFMNTTISAGGTESSQKEIYTLVNRNGTWLTDSLKVTDEKPDTGEIIL